MFEFLNNLKRKPKHVRSHIAFFSTLGIFFVIVNIWWITWKSPVSDSFTPVTEVATPLGVVADMVLGFKDKATYMATTIQKQLKDTEASTSETQTANVSASDSNNNTVYPEEIFDKDRATTSAHFQSN